VWKRDLEKDYQIRMPVWGIAASPLIEGDLVITQIGGDGEACVIALDRKTGQERWKALPDQASYSAPIMVEQAGKRVLVVWTGDRVVGMDPQTGKLHWQEAFPSRQVVIAVASPVVEGDRLFLTSFYQGSMMLRLKQDSLGVEKLWERRGQNERSTDALHSIISTPLMEGGHVYGVDSYGEFRCLDGKSGDRVWEDLTAVPKARWATIHFVKNGDRTWMFNERGQLIIGKLSPRGFQEISRAQLLQPTLAQLPQRGGVCWSHPAFAQQSIFARNDKELVCASLKAP
jgi:outer membrane protein assembly factor BamB